MMMQSTEDPSSSDSEEDVDQESETEEDTVDLMRKELSEVPFEDLQKLQQRVGSKVYDKALFGGRRGETNKPTEQDSRKKKFKRANKNRPQEISSKIPVSRVRNVVPVKQKVSRDPRFDDLSGKFNEQAFDSNYAFLGGVYSREKKEVKRKLKQAKTEQKKEELLRLLQRMEEQEKARIKKQREKEISKELKRQEKELVKQGKKPYFVKKSERKKMELANRYMELKKGGKVAKYLARKRRKNAAKDRRHLLEAHSKQR
ncbi:ribosomal RNA processing protein 36 homolog [Acanthaster planci]|uniref:rRNA biogenesis protein RRP36 n=1 Tax=Acanthaster planci TaxID=133434 RepID=A0A8B7ZZW3_ACAPL|nr:ribosomal RNA processing protein 36 homolog [Acanthaster planci]XP_022110960.1 ribosomal RNA processing protein 36 homolog [Acanthaster planci]XP_022110961.1 ribosomal RNA processing protein 36 homolog [Acanthaster planci]XP_022110962.1 ribosomal RNA processing protein 36 homolog [Acanthaster planci]XP_022110964.1 ribosomal RNA processing protein 36 homolog [Acanthaster planci]XP_022110965.1 ribosomal RNA processing protein 36 homolog [Acanthaster planci]XP_022110966.1 ribosomal RNA proces